MHQNCEDDMGDEEEDEEAPEPLVSETVAVVVDAEGVTEPQ